MIPLQPSANGWRAYAEESAAGWRSLALVEGRVARERMKWAREARDLERVAYWAASAGRWYAAALENYDWAERMTAELRRRRRTT